MKGGLGAQGLERHENVELAVKRELLKCPEQCAVHPRRVPETGERGWAASRRTVQQRWRQNGQIRAGLRRVGERNPEEGQHWAASPEGWGDWVWGWVALAEAAGDVFIWSAGPGAAHGGAAALHRADCGSPAEPGAQGRGAHQQEVGGEEKP